MALIPGTLVKADHALDRAVRNALSVPLYRIGEKKEEGYHRSALNSSVLVSQGGIQSSSSMFVIVRYDVKQSGGNAETYRHYIRVVDLATYSADNYSENYICGEVLSNGSSYSVKTIEIEVLKNNSFYLYVIKTENGFEIIKSDVVLGYSQYTPNILIGRVNFTGDSPKITQDNVTGAIYLDSPYTGMFSVDVCGENNNGSISYMFSVSGGDAYANMTHFSVESLQKTNIPSGTTYIYFSVEYDTSDYTFQNGSIESYNSVQSDSQYKKYILIATIQKNFDNVVVQQHQYGAARVFFWGECDHGDE